MVDAWLTLFCICAGILGDEEEPFVLCVGDDRSLGSCADLVSNIPYLEPVWKMRERERLSSQRALSCLTLAPTPEVKMHHHITNHTTNRIIIRDKVPLELQ